MIEYNEKYKDFFSEKYVGEYIKLKLNNGDVFLGILWGFWEAITGRHGLMFFYLKKNDSDVYFFTQQYQQCEIDDIMLADNVEKEEVDKSLLENHGLIWDKHKLIFIDKKKL